VYQTGTHLCPVEWQGPNQVAQPECIRLNAELARCVAPAKLSDRHPLQRDSKRTATAGPVLMEMLMVADVEHLRHVAADADGASLADDDIASFGSERPTVVGIVITRHYGVCEVRAAITDVRELCRIVGSTCRSAETHRGTGATRPSASAWLGRSPA
jgi:hypothetical protein